MTTKKILDENDVKKIISAYFTEQKMEIEGIKINVKTKCMGIRKTTTYPIFDNITVLIKEKK